MVLLCSPGAMSAKGPNDKDRNAALLDEWVMFSRVYNTETRILNSFSDRVEGIEECNRPRNIRNGNPRGCIYNQFSADVKACVRY